MAALIQDNGAHATGTSINLAYSSNTQGGNTLIAAVAAVVGTRTFTFSDNVYGNWNTDLNANISTRSIGVGSIFTNGASGSPPTVTSTISGASTTQHLLIMEWSGILSSSAFDKSASNLNGSAQSGVTGTTPTLSQAIEVAISILISSGANDSTIAPSAPYTAQPHSPQVSSSASCGFGYLVTASTAGTGCTFTWTGASAASYGAVATYKVLTVAQIPPTFRAKYVLFNT